MTYIATLTIILVMLGVSSLGLIMNEFSCFCAIPSQRSYLHLCNQWPHSNINSSRILIEIHVRIVRHLDWKECVKHWKQSSLAIRFWRKQLKAFKTEGEANPIDRLQQFTPDSRIHVHCRLTKLHVLYILYTIYTIYIVCLLILSSAASFIWETSR